MQLIPTMPESKAAAILIACVQLLAVEIRVGEAQYTNLVDILSEDTSHQSILGIVGHLHDLLLSLECSDHRDWTEDLIFVNLCAACK